MTEERGVAALPMYDLDEIRPAVDELWAAIRGHLGRGPTELTWGPDDDVCRDPQLVLSQTCGWPLVTTLAGTVTTVGAFGYRLGDDGTGVRYRSLILASEPRPLASFAGTTGAINGWDSLSGWVSLGVALASYSHGRPFFTSVVETGTHLGSIEAVRTGQAEVASIDAVTFALLDDHRPDALDGLVVVGRGPLVPTLPLVTAAGDPEPLRQAITAAVTDPRTAACRARLRIGDFVAIGESAYAGLPALGRIARQVIPPRL